MNKKLLSVVMSGAMIASACSTGVSAAETGFKDRVVNFVKNHKSIVIGGAVTGAAAIGGTIAWLVYHNRDRFSITKDIKLINEKGVTMDKVNIKSKSKEEKKKEKEKEKEKENDSNEAEINPTLNTLCAEMKVLATGVHKSCDKNSYVGDVKNNIELLKNSLNKLSENDKKNFKICCENFPIIQKGYGNEILNLLNEIK